MRSSINSSVTNDIDPSAGLDTSLMPESSVPLEVGLICVLYLLSS